MISLRQKLIAGFIAFFILILSIYSIFIYFAAYKRILKYEEEKINIFSSSIVDGLEKYLSIYLNHDYLYNEYKILDDYIQDLDNPDWQIFVTDKKGMLLYGSNIGENKIKFLKPDFSKYPSVRNALLGNWGLKKIVINKTTYYTSSQFLSGVNWIFIVQVRSALIVVQAVKVVLPQIIITIVIMLILLLIGLSYLNKIIIPIEKLTKAMKEYGKYNNIKIQENAENDEISLAIKTYNKMIDERKKLEKEILKISENERLRIGHDIHDDLGQILTGIAFQVMLQEQQPKFKNNKTVSKISELVNQAINKSRLIAKGLSPVLLYGQGFIIAVEEYLKNIENVYGIECALNYSKHINITNHSVSLNLYHIIQESINNAIKHGKAKKISVDLYEENDFFILKIYNDGTGFNKKKSEGIGLKVMKYRANLIDGKLEINNLKNKGLEVVCSFNKIMAKENNNE